MGTRSTISIHHKDGSIRTVYCHWDGYYEHNGVILYNFYNSPRKVNKLIDYGSISSLGTEIGKRHKFSKLYYGCTFYYRDRGEEKMINTVDFYTDINPYKNIEEEEYNYVFVEKNSEWLAKKQGEKIYKKLGDIFRTMSFSDWVIPVSNEKQYQKMIEFYKKYGKADMKIPEINEVLYEI